MNKSFECYCGKEVVKKKKLTVFNQEQTKCKNIIDNRLILVKSTNMGKEYKLPLKYFKH